VVYFDIVNNSMVSQTCTQLGTSFKVKSRVHNNELLVKFNVTHAHYYIVFIETRCMNQYINSLLG